MRASLLLFALLLPMPACPQAPLTAAEDHQRLLDLLHITALRPGVSHDASGPNPVNYDEAKANPWPLPNPLLFADGTPVRTARDWQTGRRPELFAIFDREILGRVPAHVPAVRWEVASTTPGTEGTTATLTKKLLGHVDNSAYPALTVTLELALTLPAAAKGPVPIVLELTFENYPRPRTSAVDKAAAPPEVHPTWKEQVLARGWGYALLYPTTVQPDNGAGLTSGIIGLTSHGQPRQPDDWGVLRAWAWGASRALDYFASDPAVDAAHVAIEGHSRFGKAALVAMAYDPRFAVAFVNSSGAGGASPARRRFGEQLENIAAPGEYHWMAGNYLKYAELTPTPTIPAGMPVDMHELLALCAPRPVFLAGGTVPGGDGWADTAGSFVSASAASPVYTLLGRRGLGATTLPPVGTALISGDLGFFQHPGGHTPLPSFPTFLTFASRYFPVGVDPGKAAETPQDAHPGTPTPPQSNGATCNPNKTAPYKYVKGDGTVMPQITYSVEPNFSEAARKYKIAGNVVIGLTVELNGAPKDVHVIRSITEDQTSPKLRAAAGTLDTKAIEAVQQYRYKPATCKGVAVPMALTVEVNFMIF